MLTQQEKEYIDLSIASGLGEKTVLQSFLQQSGWSQEKIESALAYSGQDSLPKETFNPYLTPTQVGQNQEVVHGVHFEEELETSLPDSSESIGEGAVAITPSDTKSPHTSLAEHFSELEKQESVPLKINMHTESTLSSEQNSSVIEEDRTFLPTQEKNFSQETFSKGEGSTPALVVAHDENGEPHSIFHLVMIFLLIFFVLVVCVVGLLFWLDIGPFSSITYTKIK